MELAHAHATVIEGGEEVQITAVGVTPQRHQDVQTVNMLARWHHLERGFVVSMFHHAVVLRKGDIIAGRLDAQNEAELVVYLDCRRPHVVLETAPFDAGVVPAPKLILILAAQLAHQEHRHVLRFHRQHGFPNQAPRTQDPSSRRA